MTQPTSTPRYRFFQEPLVHFVMLAALVFAANWALSEPDARPVIRVGAAEVEEFRQRFGQRNFRPPTADEVHRFRENRINEEVLYREGLALGLDQDDPVIKARIISKMQLLLADDGALPDPGDQVLADFMEDNAERYRSPARYSFELIRLPGEPERHHALLRALNNGADPVKAGLTPTRFRERNTAAVRASFPEPFLTTLEQARDQRQWQTVTLAGEPALLRVSGYQPPGFPQLDSARDRLLSDWRRAQRVRRVERQVARMQSSYTIQR